jgi:AsmA protein
VSDAAATVQLQNQFAAFDILDATAFEGELRAALRVDNHAEGASTALKIAASNVDGAAFGSAVGMTLLAPTGRGSVSLALRGSGHDIRSVIETGDGTLSVHFGGGTLSKFDLAGFLERCRKGGFFPLEEVSNGSLEVDGVDLDAQIVNGVVSIDKAEARFGERRLWVSGLASHTNRGLALNGGVGPLLTPAEENPAPAPTPPVGEAAFFVGGSWNAPFISPLRLPGN